LANKTKQCAQQGLKPGPLNPGDERTNHEATKPPQQFVKDSVNMVAEWYDHKPTCRGNWSSSRHVNTDFFVDTATLSLFMILHKHWHKRIKTYLKQALVLSLFLLVLEPTKQVHQIKETILNFTLHSWFNYIN